MSLRKPNVTHSSWPISIISYGIYSFPRLGISFFSGQFSGSMLVWRGVFRKKDGNYRSLKCFRISQLFGRLQWKKGPVFFLSDNHGNQLPRYVPNDEDAFPVLLHGHVPRKDEAIGGRVSCLSHFFWCHKRRLNSASNSVELLTLFDTSKVSMRM